MMYGVDYSHHQGDVEPRLLKTEGNMQFAIVKATEGKDYEDPRFRSNWEKLLELDPAGDNEVELVRGIYHFARMDLRPDWGRSAGELEANWMCSVLKEVGGYMAGALTPALDWEKYGGNSLLNREWIQGFIDVTFNEIGRRPMIYSGPNAWYYTTADWGGLVEDTTLWEVKYNADGSVQSANPPRMPRSGDAWDWTFWQWSAGGEFKYYYEQFGLIPGIPSGICDVNRYDGTYADLLSLALIETPVTPMSGILPLVDLASYGTSSYVQVVAVVQGLLMANGYGPSGLVNSSTGLPDGKAGSKTLAAFAEFKAKYDLGTTTWVDPATWWQLQQSDNT